MVNRDLQASAGTDGLVLRCIGIGTIPALYLVPLVDGFPWISGSSLAIVGKG